MPYLFLMFAIGAEIIGTSVLKETHGFTRLVPTVACVGVYAISFALLAQALKSLPVGFTYAVWSGVGIIAITTIGAVFLQEALTPLKVAGIALVVGGVALLNIGGVH